MRENEWNRNRTRWGHLKDGRKACWVCLSREQETGEHEFKKWKSEHDKLEVIKEVIEC